MSRVSLRLLALTVVAIVTLGACAVPTQPGSPGVAAEFHGRTITNEEVTETLNALYSLSYHGQPDQMLTLLLIGPEAAEAAATMRAPLSRDEAVSMVYVWVAINNGKQIEPTDRVLDLVTYARAIETLQATDAGLAILADLVSDVVANATVSPRYGTFSEAAVTQSIAVARETASNRTNELGPVTFAPYANITGFFDEPEEWVSTT